MKKSEVKLIALVLLSSCLLLLNIFIKNILSEYLLAIFLGVILGISVFLVGFEHNKLQNRKAVLSFIITYTIAFLVLLYGIGLFTGYLKSPYSFSPLNILKNISSSALIIVVGEYLRYNLCRKGENNKYVLILVIVLFCLVDVSMSVNQYNLRSIGGLLGMSTVVLIPSIFKNILLNDLALRFGPVPGLIYSLIMGLYIYLIPIMPNLNDYMTSTVMFLLPLALKILVDKRFTKEDEEEEDLRENKIPGRIINGILIAIMIILIGLFSNLFTYWIAAVGSGSMEPTINIGDAIVVDKSVQNHLDHLNVGDVLVFKIQNTIYTHRIIEMKETNGNYAITTKGDREGQAVDTWVVTNKDVVGVVKFRIPFVGWPTVWLSRIVEG